MPKYRDYFRKMIDENSEMFEEFAKLHAKYAEDRSANQEEFNEKGEKVVEVIREWEGRLCGKTEKGDKAVFSAGLADKYWGEVKAFFPMIDFVGVEVVKKAKSTAVKKVEKEVEIVDRDMAEIDMMDVDEGLAWKKLI